MDKILLDEKGYQEYLEQIEQIKKKIDKNAKDIATFASDDAFGDGWHDNFAYEEATKKESALYQELDKKMKGLKDIEIIKENKDKNTVSINSLVTILFDDEEEPEKYYITGNVISNMDNEIPSITVNSPLGNAIYNKKINEHFVYKVGEKEMGGIIINIEYDS